MLISEALEDRRQGPEKENQSSVRDIIVGALP
jgi:hypothetical protein